jgi:hypothetical protein
MYDFRCTMYDFFILSYALNLQICFSSFSNLQISTFSNLRLRVQSLLKKNFHRLIKQPRLQILALRLVGEFLQPE